MAWQRSWSVRRAALSLALVGSAGMPSAQMAAIDIHVVSRALQPGELIVVTLSLDTAATDVHVAAFGRHVAAFIDRDRWRAVIGIDLEQAPGRYELIATARLGGDALRESRRLVVRPKKFTTRRLRVAPDFVDPSAPLRERIAHESQRVNDTYQRSSSERLWRTPFAQPVPARANSRFGQRSLFNGQPRGRHAGTDFLSPAGTPIKAPSGGRVVLAEDLFLSGKTVIIDHGLQMFSLLAHMSAIDVKEGEAVSAGQVLGRVGATGRVTGPHLHWAMRVAGARVDPLSAIVLLK